MNAKNTVTVQISCEFEVTKTSFTKSSQMDLKIILFSEVHFL